MRECPWPVRRLLRLLRLHLGAASRLGALVLACVWLPLAAGCATDRPSMSGFAIGDLRIVSEGDIVELRYPLRADGSREWRVTSYDSFHLQLVDNPTIVRRPDGRAEMLMRARARAPGDTTVVVTEQPPTQGPPRVIRFQIRITR